MAGAVLANACFPAQTWALFAHFHMLNSPKKAATPGAGYLKTGDHAIHFYYSAAEQLRFAAFLQEGLERGGAAIVAAVGERHPLLAAVWVPRIQRRRTLLKLQVTPNLHVNVTTLGHAAAALLAWARDVRIVVDFDGLVSTQAILANEAELSRALLGKRAITISQYDGNAFPAPVMMEQFHTHALTLVGDAFYSENRQCVRPEEYLIARRSPAQASAAAAAGAARVR